MALFSESPYKTAFLLKKVLLILLSNFLPISLLLLRVPGRKIGHGHVTLSVATKICYLSPFPLSLNLSQFRKFILYTLVSDKETVQNRL